MPKLLDLQSVAKTDPSRVPRYLPLDAKNNCLIVLDQVRKTRPSSAELERMRQSFLHEGQISAGVVVVLPKSEAIEYLKQIGLLWNKTYNISDYRRARWEGKTYYLFVAAGHMRLETAQSLCADHDEGSLSDSGKFRLGYYTELRFGLTAAQAVQIQITENVNHPVDPIDEKFAAQMVYQWKLSQDERFTKKDLAKMFHRTTSWVETAILLAELPEAIQRLGIEPGEDDSVRAVVPQYILEGVARLARFRTEIGSPMTEVEMSEEVFGCVAKGLNSTQHSQQVSDQIRHLRGDGGQATMDLQGGFDRFRDPKIVRQIAGQGITATMAGLKQALRLLKQMLENGLLDRDVNPLQAEVDPRMLEKYSFGSPSHNLGELGEMFSEILPLLALYVDKDKQADLRTALSNSDSVNGSEIILRLFGQLENEAAQMSVASVAAAE